MRRLRIAAWVCVSWLAVACGRTAGDRLLCDDLDLRAPSAIGIDVTTGKRVWSWCPTDTIPPLVMGRAAGSTIFWQQGSENELVALDDKGVELWRHATSGSWPQVAIGNSTVVVVDNAVVAVDALTGGIRWQHESGSPLAAREGLLVETIGASSLRAVDLVTGTERWTQAASIGENQYAPTVGNAVLAIPDATTSETEIRDIATGQILRTEHGLLWAMGDLLVTLGAADLQAGQLSDAVTGRRLASASGMPQLLQADAEHDSRGSDLLLATSSPGSSGTQRYRLVDATTGQTRWTVDEGAISAVTTTRVVVSSTRTITLLDGATGAVLWRYSVNAPSRFVGSVLGTSVVVAIPTNTGFD